MARPLTRPDQAGARVYPSTARTVLLRIHNWVGLVAGLYLVVVTLTGSVLVYRNALYTAFFPETVFVEGGGLPLTGEALTELAVARYPGWDLHEVQMGDAPNQAARLTLRSGGRSLQRLVHPYSGADLGNAVPLGHRVLATLLELHDNLLGGATGRALNGAGALALVVLCVTGAILWWPGSQRWTRGLRFELRGGSLRVAASVHKALGFWVLAFLVLWGVTGTYLAFQDAYSQFFDFLQPPDPDAAGERVVDRIQYWLAYLHFGRLGGRGIPGCGRGLCNSITMGTWAVIALAPTVLFVTGTLLWWKKRGRRKS
jgi:uncharacterized iron-regulated membrane protein